MTTIFVYMEIMFVPIVGVDKTKQNNAVSTLTVIEIRGKNKCVLSTALCD
jgi:hypothetical protein